MKKMQTIRMDVVHLNKYHMKFKDLQTQFQ